MITLDPDVETKFQIHHCKKNVIHLNDQIKEDEKVTNKLSMNKRRRHNVKQNEVNMFL